MGLADFRFKFPKPSQDEPAAQQQQTPARRPSLEIRSHHAPSTTRGSLPSGIATPSAVPSRKPRHTFKSFRLRGEFQQPWIDDKRLKRTKVGSYIVYAFIVAALAICGYLGYDGAAAAKTGDYCLIMDDKFESIDSANWQHEVQTGGFGTGSFDWTTTDKANSFTDGEGLHIVPTLTTETTGISEEQLLNGYTLNLTRSGDGDGTCTSDDWTQCSVRSNATTGAIIPPVRSARLTTKGKKFIKYGRVEVTAKMPRGDWLWPAIWMMPEESKYGEWPASGEIDIAELRGNSWKYPLGRDAVSSTLHWGPTSRLDAYWQTYGIKFIRRTDFSKGFHTFGLEWSDDYLFTYLDSRLKQVFYMGFGKSTTMWQRGRFEGQTVNNTVLENPWAKTGNANTPFDENFYLILNVAVGSQNGWFYEGKHEKPWVDKGPTAARDFYKAKEQWLSSWGEGNDRGMTVKSVKMWRQGKC